MEEIAKEDALRLANRSVRFAGQVAAIAIPAAPVDVARHDGRGPTAKLLDFLDHEDLGYPLGLLAWSAGGCALIAGWVWIAVPLIVVAVVLCWAV